MVPVTGLEPQFLGQNNRGHDFFIVILLEEFTFKINQRIADNHSFRMEEREARAFIMEAEQIQFPSQFSVISLSCFFANIEEVFKFFLLIESCAVDSLKHLTVFIASPVSAGYRHELECLNLACGTYMRASAEVSEIPLCVECNLCIFRKIFN